MSPPLGHNPCSCPAAALGHQPSLPGTPGATANGEPYYLYGISPYVAQIRGTLAGRVAHTKPLKLSGSLAISGSAYLYWLGREFAVDLAASKIPR